MAQVITANGMVDSNDLGKTLIHEHIIMGYPGWDFDADYVFDKEAIIEKIVQAIEKAKAHGVKTIVDAFPYDPKRFPEINQIVQQKTGVNIICSTGCHSYAGGVGHYWANTLATMYDPDMMRDRLAHSMIRDIEEGIDGTGIRAGIIKVATDAHPDMKMTAYEQLTFSAAGKAQKATGVPVITHTSGATLAVEQAETLIRYGANPEKVAIGHMCDTTDVDYLESVLATGVYVNFDRFGISFTCPEGEEGKMKTLVALVKKGYGKRIMISHDFCIVELGVGVQSAKFLEGRDMDSWRLDGIFDRQIPEMMKMGLTEAEVEDLLINNPRRFFA